MARLSNVRHWQDHMDMMASLNKLAAYCLDYAVGNFHPVHLGPKNQISLEEIGRPGCSDLGSSGCRDWVVEVSPKNSRSSKLILTGLRYKHHLEIKLIKGCTCWGWG